MVVFSILFSVDKFILKICLNLKDAAPCLSSSCVPYVVSFSGLSIFDWPFGIL